MLFGASYQTAPGLSMAPPTEQSHPVADRIGGGEQDGQFQEGR
jgi:hypothetical protein